MATIGSKNVTATVVPASVSGVEEILEFVNGLSKVSKKAKKFLLKRNPDIYFDPDNANSSEIKFKSNLEAVSHYISLCKNNPDVAPALCSLLKGEYENLQGELLSGKYSVNQRVDPIKQLTQNLPQDDEDDDDEDDDLVTGGDSVKSDDDKSNSMSKAERKAAKRAEKKAKKAADRAARENEEE